MKNRLDFIDIAKGLGIMLVIMGHIEHDYVPFCGSVHIPMFFVLSGYLCNLEKLQNEKYSNVVKKRAVRLLIPYFIYNIVLYLKYLAKVVVSHGSIKDAIDAFAGFLYSSSILYKGVPANENFEGFVFGNGPLWFLTAMVISSIVFYAIVFYILKFRFDIFKVGICSCVLIALSWGLLKMLPVYLPWSMEMSLIGTVFMLFGLLIRQLNVVDFIRCKMYLPVLCVVIFALLHHVNGSANMAISVYGRSIILYVILGFLGSIIMIWLALILEKIDVLNRAVSYVGRKTLIILGLHMTIISLMVSVMSKLHLEALLNWGGFFVIRFVVGLAGCLIIYEILTRVFKVPERFL